MDSLDLRLLREMFPGRVLSLRGVDPRLSVQVLARNVGASRVTVKRRLSAWKAGGFWRGLVAYPNPDILGTSFQMQGFILRAGRHRSRLEAALDRVLEPVFSFQTEDFYNPVLLKESPARTSLRQRALEKLKLCRAVCPPLDIPFVKSQVRPGPRDWRIIQALRRSPDAHWPSVAREVGVTVRGLQRRVGRLMDGQALFFFPGMDFRRFPGTVATVGLLLGEQVDVGRVAADVTKRFPDLMAVEPLFPFEKFLPPTDLGPIGGAFQFQVAVPTASSVDDIRRELGALPGVLEVVLGFPTQSTSRSEPLDSLIQLAISGSPRRR